MKLSKYWLLFLNFKLLLLLIDSRRFDSTYPGVLAILISPELLLFAIEVLARIIVCGESKSNLKFSSSCEKQSGFIIYKSGVAGVVPL
jgi:hypothetical protein